MMNLVSERSQCGLHRRNWKIMGTAKKRRYWLGMTLCYRKNPGNMRSISFHFYLIPPLNLYGRSSLNVRKVCLTSYKFLIIFKCPALV